MSEQLILFLAFLVYHWFADFKYQTHWMATNKSKDNLALLAHVSVYTLTFIFFLSCVYVISWSAGNLETGVLFQSFPKLAGFLGVNFILHFITDYVTSRISSRLWSAGLTHDFFEVVGLDQLIHQFTLAFTMYYFFFR